MLYRMQSIKNRSFLYEINIFLKMSGFNKMKRIKTE